MHALRLLWSISLCVPSLVLIAQAVFLLQRRQTDATECPNHAGGYTAGMGNNIKKKLRYRSNAVKSCQLLQCCTKNHM